MRLRAAPRGVAVAAKVAVILGVGACSGPMAPAPPAAAVAPPGASATAAPSGTVGAESGQLGGTLTDTLALVTRVRGLEAQREVRGRVIDRGEMLERLRRKLREDVPPAVVSAQAELLFALGTVPAGFDFESSLLEMMEDQLAGFYEPDDATLYLMEDLGASERFATLAHELVHALQDQHFGLAGRLDYRADANDEQSALHTLAEGDATSAMLDVIEGKSSLDTSDAVLALMLRGGVAVGSDSTVPIIVKRSVVAPYVDGVLAVQAARRRGGWDAVDALWARPPVTTEQLLHPEKWRAGEGPVAVDIPPGPTGGGWRVVFHDVEGEQSLRILYEEWAPRFKAEAGGSGWGGDRIAVFSDGERHALAWRLVFDDEPAAERAAVLFARGVLTSGPTTVSATRPAEARSGGASGDPAVPVAADLGEAAAVRAMLPGAVCAERREAGPFAVARVGRRVGVVAGPYRREKGSASSASECAAALPWVRQVAVD